MIGFKALFVVSVATILVMHRADAGVSFTRWGRTVCPTGTHTLYKGYMAGGHHAVGGSGGNYLCITDEPQFVRPKAGHQNYAGLIYGMEFEFWDFAGTFNAENIPGGQILNNDMLCVVCYVEGSYDQLVLPGRQDCGKSGYDLQYKGFMVSEWHGGRPGRGQYICMDESPEGRIGGTADDNQAVVYPVEVGCGSLPCNPFVEGYELPCAVCTY